MMMRIAVRLPGEVITFVDSEVSQNRIPSRRAAVVLRASNASDAAILTATEPNHDLDAIAEQAAKLAPTSIDAAHPARPARRDPCLYPQTGQALPRTG
ncbi:hypothetical protein [Mycobacterium canetti]|uniref:hypothetical protein n=1 Tax=Mycobacterium canetti TaxID=78331 RepID=UPI0002A5801E|nr:hypothetical protein [Mycobacterium canetti]MBC9076428.1 hypothetical protein [Mycobacterium canetti]CCK56523.1 Conserved protein of unknown function [Mycobacterium canettii CIPT 140070008]